MRHCEDGTRCQTHRPWLRHRSLARFRCGLGLHVTLIFRGTASIVAWHKRLGNTVSVTKPEPQPVAKPFRQSGGQPIGHRLRQPVGHLVAVAVTHYKPVAQPVPPSRAVYGWRRNRRIPAFTAAGARRGGNRGRRRWGRLPETDRPEPLTLSPAG